MKVVNAGAQPGSLSSISWGIHLRKMLHLLNNHESIRWIKVDPNLGHCIVLCFTSVYLYLHQPLEIACVSICQADTTLAIPRIFIDAK